VTPADLAPAPDVARLTGLLERLVAIDTQNPRDGRSRPPPSSRPSSKRSRTKNGKRFSKTEICVIGLSNGRTKPAH
jgi:hypothetical protein